jgi:serine/threonine protein kinase/tetratricopeptide (TPR) repeat protein
MPGETNRDARVELLAEALAILDREGEAAFEAFLANHPAEREGLVSRIGSLQRVGLAGAPHEAPFARLGPYKILGRIGAGGMGVVWLAEDERLGRKVAVKTLSLGVVASPIARARFDRESKAVARLAHPSIVTVHESGEQEGVAWFAMEYVAGATLADALAAVRRLGLPAREISGRQYAAALGFDPDGEPASETPARIAASLARDVAAALHHAHEHGVLHRDVKPSNVIATRNGLARLLDFGLARVEGDLALTHSRDFAGTPYYVAPEQIDGKHPLDARTDVWSLGVLLYELLTLRLPFEATSTDRVFERILTAEPRRPRAIDPRIPRDLEVVCLKALEKEPGGRYADARAFERDLQHVLDGRPVAARPISTLRRFARTAWRHKAVTLAAVSLATLFIGIPTGLYLGSRRVERERDLATNAFAFLEDIVFDADVHEDGPATPVSRMIDRLEDRVRPALADHPIAQARLLQRIGAHMSLASDLATAERCLRDALALDLEHRGDDDLETAATRNHLGNVLHLRSRLSEAETELRRALEVRSRRLGFAHPETNQTRGNLARVLVEARRFAEARPILDECRIAIGSSMERGRLESAEYRMALLRDDLLAAAGHAAAARDAFALDPGIDSTEYVGATANEARLALIRGDFERAARGYREVREFYRRVHGEGHWFETLTATFIAEVSFASGDAAAAAEELDAALPGLLEQPGDSNLDVVRAMCIRGECANRLGDSAGAIRWLERAREALERRAETSARDEGRIALALADVGRTTGDLTMARRAIERFATRLAAIFGDRRDAVAEEWRAFHAHALRAGHQDVVEGIAPGRDAEPRTGPPIAR